MKTTLRTDRTIKDICDGFVYNEYEVRAVSGYNVFLRLNIETGAKTYDRWGDE